VLVDLKDYDILIHSNSIGDTSCESQSPLITEHITDTQKQSKVTIETTTPAMLSGKQHLNYCIETSGNTVTDKYQRDTVSTIKTETQVTTAPKTLSAYPLHNIKQNIEKKVEQGEEPQKDLNILQTLETKPQNGTGLQKEERGTENTQEKSYSKSYPKSSAQSVVLSSNQVQAEISYVLVSAKDYEEIGYYEKGKQEKEVPVYDLMVEEDHEFFAWGILIHNCIDCISMLSLLETWKPSADTIGMTSRPTANNTPQAPDVYEMWVNSSADQYEDDDLENPLNDYVV
jgi:hypothetical protein